MNDYSTISTVVAAILYMVGISMFAVSGGASVITAIQKMKPSVMSLLGKSMVGTKRVSLVLGFSLTLSAYYILLNY